jgi:hypothetical protein
VGYVKYYFMLANRRRDMGIRHYFETKEAAVQACEKAKVGDWSFYESGSLYNYKWVPYGVECEVWSAATDHYNMTVYKGRSIVFRCNWSS